MRFILLLCLTFIIPFSHAGLAGHVIIAKGEVVAVNTAGETRALQRRSEIYSGDTLRTGDDGNAQIRFIDKALLTLKPDSELNITDYQMASAEDKTSEKAVMNLVKGGFRTITGSIGKGDKAAYKVSTPAASIGIRGTNYEVQQESAGSFVMAVYSGGINVQNASGSLDLGMGAAFNYSRVSANAAPKGLLQPPSSLNNPPRKKKSSGGDGKGEKSSSKTNSEGGGDEENSDDSAGDDSTADDSSSENNDESNSDTADSSDSSNTADNSDSGNTDSGSSFADTSAMGDANSSSTAGLENVTSLINNNLPAKEDAIIAATDTAIQENPTTPTTPVVLFDFANPMAGVDLIPNLNPEILTDDEYSLLQSGKLAMLAIPVNGAYEAALFSPYPAAFDGTQAYSFPAFGTRVYFDYIDPGSILTAGNIVFNVSIDGGATYTPLTVSLAAASGNSDLMSSVSSALSASGLMSSVYVYSDIDGRVYLYPMSGDIEINVSSSDFTNNLGLQNKIYTDLGTVGVDINYKLYGSDTTQTFRLDFGSAPETIFYNLSDFVTFANNLIASQNLPFAFAIDPNDSTRLTLYGTEGGSYVSMLEIGDIVLGEYSLNDSMVPGDYAAQMSQLLEVLGGMAPGLHYNVDKAEVVIGMGTIDSAGNAVYHNINQECDDMIETSATSTCSETVRHDILNNAEVSTYSEFLNCLLSATPCDIKVRNVNNRSNVSWGAWVLSADEPVTISKETTDGILYTKDEYGLKAVYWVQAEPAAINTLTGTASFSASSNCTDFSQCMGVSNDGLVKSVNGSFNVNFTSGAISNGVLTVATMANPTTQATNNTWNVNFSGAVSGAQFQSTSLTGTISGADACTPSCVTGDIGGLFVKPGNAAVGGFQLQNTTTPAVNASGVFIMQKN
ncbi:MAG: FecR domain-containing protein [Oceanospirillaceae bacterium]|nr:FecR domain-containing protein [Oceanospirillaceae bacterium]MCP5350268.1 FecR domain-containing protein [Oceanospirillaceae bacterium]